MTKNTTANTVARKIAGQTSTTSKANGASGDDTEDNLVELCGACHRKVHDGSISKQELLKIVKRRKRNGKKQ